MGIDTQRAAKLAVPALEARANDMAAEAAEMYESLVAMHNKVIAFRADLLDLAVVLREVAPPRAVAAVGTPAGYFAEVSADRIDRMTLAELQSYCADSGGVGEDSCRQAVTPKPVHTGGRISGHRPHGRFANLQIAVGLEAAPASDWLLIWRWLATRPDGADCPGDWPTRYSYLRAVPDTTCAEYLRAVLLAPVPDAEASASE